MRYSYVMEYTTLGKTGERVSVLGMGGMRFSQDISDDDAVAAIHRANRLGVNYFDTAPGYCKDRSEVIYGKALENMPTDDWHIATKGSHGLSRTEVLEKIAASRERFHLNVIDFYLLWCVITLEQFDNARKPGQCLEGILEARDRGWIRHVGVSSHLASEGLERIIDDGTFDFLMVPYNAVNFGQREEAVRRTVEKGMGVVAMNPLHGGIIARYRDDLKIFDGSGGNGVEEGLRFCVESPYIDVALSGMNSVGQVEENVMYAERYAPLDPGKFEARVKELRASFKSMCTSCGYCVDGCPASIFIPSYMEVYNHHLLTDDPEGTVERMRWHKKLGPLRGKTATSADCTECGQCEEVCTQYLDVMTRLKWISEEVEPKVKVEW